MKAKNDIGDLASGLAELLNGMEMEVTPDVLPNMDELMDYKFATDRKIYFDQDVDEKLTVIQKLILYYNMQDRGKPIEERKPILLYIMSYGGDADYMFSLIDTILASVTPVYTINMGVAASAAALIFIAGKERYMAKRARVLIHEGSAEFKGDATKVQNMTDSYKKLLQRMKAYIVEHTKITMAQLSKKRKDDWELDAEECLKNGVCTHVFETLEEIM